MTDEIKALLKEYYSKGFRYVLMSCDDDIFISKFSFTNKTPTDFLFSRLNDEVIYCPLTTLRELFDETPFRRIRIAELIDEVGWGNVKIDTPVTMHNSKGVYYAHFCKYENGKIYIYQSGITSWTARNYEDDCTYCVPEDSKVYLAPERLEK